MANAGLALQPAAEPGTTVSELLPPTRPQRVEKAGSRDAIRRHQNQPSAGAGRAPPLMASPGAPSAAGVLARDGRPRLCPRWATRRVRHPTFVSRPSLQFIQQRLNFLPLPQGQIELRASLASERPAALFGD